MYIYIWCILYVYVFFKVFSIGCSTTHSWYLGILKIKVGVGWWLWKSIDRYLPMFFQFNPAIHGHRVTNLPSPKTLQQGVYESIHVWIGPLRKNNIHKYCTNDICYFLDKMEPFSPNSPFWTHTHADTNTHDGSRSRCVDWRCVCNPSGFILRQLWFRRCGWDWGICLLILWSFLFVRFVKDIVI